LTACKGRPSARWPDANHRGGRKYIKGTRTERPGTTDAQKAEAAEIFRAYRQRALENPRYLTLRRRHEASVRAAVLA